MRDERRWSAGAGAGLAVLGAAAVMGIRLAVGHLMDAPKEVGRVREVAAEKEAPRVFVSIPGHLLEKEHAAELARWMEDHPGDVMHFIDRLEDREQARTLAVAFVRAVQGPHYDLLLSWMNRHEDKELAAVVFREMIPRLIRENPDECIAMGFALGPSEAARMTRDQFFFALPLEQRVRLVNQQTTEERAWLLSRRATGFGERAPELCLDLIKKLPPSPHRSEALGKLMKAWADGANVYHTADPLSAVKGVMALEDPALRKEGLRMVVSEWSQSNPDIASRWITRQEAGADRDAAIEGLVNRLASTNPEAAMEWAGAISDEALKRKTVEHLENTPPTKPEGSK